MATEHIAVKIETSGELEAIRQGAKDLGLLRENAHAAGLDTRSLDVELRKANQEFSKRYVQEYAQNLHKLMAEAKAAGQSTAHLDRQLKVLQKTKPLGARGRIGQVAREAVDELPGIGRITRAFKGAGGPVGATVEVVRMAAQGISASVKEFAASEERYAKLDVALAKSGQLTDGYRQKLSDLADELQNTTGVADDEWLGVLGTLTEFGSRPETVGMDVEAVKNLAGLLGGDLHTATSMIGQALQGNFDLFSQYDIVLDENGTQAQKLEKLYQTLAQRGGGMLEASNRTQLGQWRQLKNAFSDLGEAVGSRISQTGILQGVMANLAFVTGWWAEKIGTVPPKLAGLKNATEQTINSSNSAAEATSRHAAGLDQVKSAADKAAESLNKANREAEAESRHQDKLQDLEMAKQLELIKGREDLTPSQKIAAEQEIRKKFRSRDQTRRDREAAEKIGREEASADAALQEFKSKKQSTEQLRQEVAQLEKVDASARALEDAVAAVTEARRAQKAFEDSIPPNLSPFGDPDAAEIANERALHAKKVREAEATKQAASDRALAAFASAGMDWNEFKFGDLPQKRAELAKSEKSLEEARKKTAATDTRAADSIEKIQKQRNGERKTENSETELDRIKTARERQTAQTQEIIKPLPEGVKVTEDAAKANQLIAERNTRAEAGFVQLGRALEQGNQKLADVLLRSIENMQRQNDELRRRLRVVESQSRAGRAQN